MNRADLALLVEYNYWGRDRVLDAVRLLEGLAARLEGRRAVRGEERPAAARSRRRRRP